MVCVSFRYLVKVMILIWLSFVFLSFRIFIVLFNFSFWSMVMNFDLNKFVWLMLRIVNDVECFIFVFSFEVYIMLSI